MAEAHVTVEGPKASKVEEVVDEVPIKNKYISEEVVGGNGISVIVFSEAFDDPESVADDIIEYSSVKASAVSVE